MVSKSLEVLAVRTGYLTLRFFYLSSFDAVSKLNSSLAQDDSEQVSEASVSNYHCLLR